MTDRDEIAYEVRRYAEGAANAALMLDAIARHGTVADVIAADATPAFMEWIADHEIDTDADLWEALDVALEVVAQGEASSPGDWRVTGWRIVTGTGGPHVEAEIGTGGAITGAAYWGSHKYIAHTFGADALAEALEEMWTP